MEKGEKTSKKGNENGKMVVGTGKVVDWWCDWGVVEGWCGWERW